MSKLAQLQPPDTFHLSSAAGWIELGNHLETNEELEKINASLRAHPDVLELRWMIYSHFEKWDGGLNIATAIIKQAPDRAFGWIHRAYSMRRTKRGGIEEAKKILEDAAGLFPQEWLIPYNLACYCAQLGQLDKAKDLLHASYELGDKKQIKLMALEDEDLEPLWKIYE